MQLTLIRSCPAAVIPVDHLSHQPEIRLFCLCPSAQFFHEPKFKTIRTVQTDSVNAKFIDPEIHNAKQIFANRLVVKIQNCQIPAAMPGFVGKTIVIGRVSVKIDALIPVLIRRIPFFLPDIPKGKKISAGVVKYPIYNNLYSHFMCFLHKALKILIVPKPAVNLFVVDCIVPVRCGLKQRSDIDGPEPQITDMRKPFFRQNR